MQLSDWLKEHDVRRSHFAERIAVSPSYVTALCNGTVWPGRDVLERIERETGGAVLPNDFFRADPPEAERKAV